VDAGDNIMFCCFSFCCDTAGSDSKHHKGE
jgi:hypothetical protein